MLVYLLESSTWNAFPTQLQIPAKHDAADFVISNTSDETLEYTTTYSNRGLTLAPATGVLPPKSRLSVRVQPRDGPWPRQEQIFVLCNGQQEVVSLQLGSIDDEAASSPRLSVSDKSSPRSLASSAAPSGFVWTPAGRPARCSLSLSKPNSLTQHTVKVQQDSFQVSPEIIKFDEAS